MAAKLIREVIMRLTPSLLASLAFAISIAAVPPARAVLLDTPTLQVVSADRVSATLLVRAGDSGAPGGFVVTYMQADDYDALGGWPEDAQQGNPYVKVLDCTFTGVPTLEVTPGAPSFCLDPGQAVQVVVGKLFDETGVSATDPEDVGEELSEGTGYVFRVRAAASLGIAGSGHSVTIECPIPSRGSNDCTVTARYWRRHPEAWSRVTSLRLGSVLYSHDQLVSIFDTPARGNGLIALCHQLIAAELNQLLGVTPPAAVMTAMGQANDLIGALMAPPVGMDSLRPSLVNPVRHTLDAFNCGRLGPAHCPSSLSPVPATPETWGRIKALYH